MLNNVMLQYWDEMWWKHEDWPLNVNFTWMSVNDPSKHVGNSTSFVTTASVRINFKL